MVDTTAASSKFFTLSGNPELKNPFRIYMKICFNVSGDDLGRFSMLNLRLILFVMSALPPEGGAAQAIMVVSTTSFHTQSPLSKSPFLSSKSLNSSIGG